MTFEWFVLRFGYPAILVGTFFEGEIILILAGFAAHRGYLELPLVMAVAFVGTMLGDQLYFFLGRRRGRAFLLKHPDWEERIVRFRKLMDRHDVLILLLFRFLYGLRTVAPFAIGLSDISARKFIIFNILSAAAWTVVISLLGYVFGHAVEAVLTDIKRLEIAIMAVLLVLALALYLFKRYRKKKDRR